MRKTDILDVMSRKLSPFVMLFGFYVIAYGHLSPGGGFQGGVMLASGFILLLLAKAGRVGGAFFSERVFSFVETLGLGSFLLAGALGLLGGGAFLSVLLVPGLGRSGLPSFTLILNTIIGFEVGSGIGLMCLYLIGRPRDD